MIAQRQRTKKALVLCSLRTWSSSAFSLGQPDELKIVLKPSGGTLHLRASNEHLLVLINTVNLPKTDFPLKGNLAQNEPLRLQKWQELDILRNCDERAKGAPCSCFTTVHRTPMARSTSDTSSTKFLRISASSPARCWATGDPYIPGWSRPAIIQVVLAIDTALEACSVAVLDTERGDVVASESLPMARGHAEALVPLLARVMDKAYVAFFELDRIAVTTGPGSFTGLRVGISAARGIALAVNKPALGLSTLAAYAAPHIAADDSVPIAVAIDARHDHVYLQVFGPGGRTLVAPRISSIRDAVRAAMAGPARLVGSAAQLVANAWPNGEPPPPLVDAQGAPDVDWVARLGAAAADNHAPPKPLYLRAPDAQPQDAARLARR